MDLPQRFLASNYGGNTHTRSQANKSHPLRKWVSFFREWGYISPGNSFLDRKTTTRSQKMHLSVAVLGRVPVIYKMWPTYTQPVRGGSRHWLDVGNQAKGARSLYIFLSAQTYFESHPVENACSFTSRYANFTQKMPVLAESLFLSPLPRF